MELVYTDAKTEEQCTSLKVAKKLFGGNDALAKKPILQDKCFETSGDY